MLDLLYNGCMHDVGFQTNLTVRIHRGIADVSALDARFFCVGIITIKNLIHLLCPQEVCHQLRLFK